MIPLVPCAFSIPFCSLCSCVLFLSLLCPLPLSMSSSSCPLPLALSSRLLPHVPSLSSCPLPLLMFPSLCPLTLSLPSCPLPYVPSLSPSPLVPFLMSPSSPRVHLAPFSADSLCLSPCPSQAPSFCTPLLLCPSACPLSLFFVLHWTDSQV